MIRWSPRKNIRRRRSVYWPSIWRRRPATAICIIALSLFLAWARFKIPAPAGSDHDRYQNQTFTCVRVVDGDTVDINIPDGKHQTTRIRLWGVDTPETKDSRIEPMYYGPEATSFTTSLVEGKNIRIVLAPDQSRDKYGRLLAYVYLNENTMLNEEIIAQGFGYADSRFPHAWRERFQNLEERAQKKKAGLWEKVTPQQFPAWRQRHEQWLEEVQTHRHAD